MAMSEVEGEKRRIPVTVLTGFLGSGREFRGEHHRGDEWVHLLHGERGSNGIT